MGARLKGVKLDNAAQVTLFLTNLLIAVSIYTQPSCLTAIEVPIRDFMIRDKMPVKTTNAR